MSAGSGVCPCFEFVLLPGVFHSALLHTSSHLHIRNALQSAFTNPEANCFSPMLLTEPKDQQVERAAEAARSASGTQPSNTALPYERQRKLT